jgi:hypothetical protein
MSETMMYVLAGAAGAVVYAMVLRMAAVRHPIRRHATALLVAAVIYVVFAVRGGSEGGVAVELAGAAAFGGVALLGLVRRAPGIVALGWALHPVWDVALHTAGAGLGYTPHGYVPACIGFDLLLALLIALGWAGAPAGRLRLAPARPRP